MSKWQVAVDQLIKESGVTVRRWRNTNSGVAFCGADDWGIEIPVPKGPVTFVIGAHEIGHQLKHRNGKTPRWVEEVEAWEYSLEQLTRFELPDQAGRAMKFMTRKIDYAFMKAIRRGVSLERIEERFPKWVERVVEAMSYEPGRYTVVREPDGTFVVLDKQSLNLRVFGPRSLEACRTEKERLEKEHKEAQDSV